MAFLILWSYRHKSNKIHNIIHMWKLFEKCDDNGFILNHALQPASSHKQQIDSICCYHKHSCWWSSEITNCQTTMTTCLFGQTIKAVFPYLKKSSILRWFWTTHMWYRDAEPLNFALRAQFSKLSSYHRTLVLRVSTFMVLTLLLYYQQ